MGYSYQTRQKLVADFKEKWNRKLLTAGRETKRQVKEVEKIGQYNEGSTTILDEAMKTCMQEKIAVLSELMKKHYKKLTELYIEKQYMEDYYDIIDKLNQFPYSRNMYRRTVRTKRYFPQTEHVFSLLQDYRMLSFFGCSPAEYLRNELSPEKLDYKRNSIYGFGMKHFDDIIAARIDRKDQDVIGTVKDLILGDNNTAVITAEVIRGIVKSSDTELHQLLADFLLAARLQEGVRQAVCENADCGTIQAFIRILETICDNGLIRFAAVKRAAAAWTGICDLEHADRISEKMLSLMRESIKNPEIAKEYLKTNDSIQISIGLWTLGAYELMDAIDVMKYYLEHGTRNQILTMSYFNRTLEWPGFTGIAAKEAILKFPEDAELAAAFFPTYLSSAENYVYQALNYAENRTKEVKVYEEIPLSLMFENEKEARIHYEILKKILAGLKKKQLEFSPCIFPWYHVYLSRTQIIKRMSVIAYMLKDASYIEEMASQLSLLDVSENYTTRGSWIELLLHEPANEKQKGILLGYIADKETTARDTAFQIANRLTLSPPDYLLLEGFLRYKSGDIRRNVLKLLGKQEDNELFESVSRLLAGSQEGMRDGGLSLVIEAQKAGRDEKLLQKLAEKAGELKNASDKEQILIQEITGGSPVLKKEGFGLYRPSFVMECPAYPHNHSIAEEYFKFSTARFDRIVKKLTALIKENAGLEYKNSFGDEVLLGNGLMPMEYDESFPFADRYPFRELWEQFYEKEIGDAHVLELLIQVWDNQIEVYGGKIKNRKTLKKYEKQLLGKEMSSYQIPDHPYTANGINSSAYTVLLILSSVYKESDVRQAALELADMILKDIPKKDLWYEVERDDSRYYYGPDEEYYALTDIPALNRMLQTLKKWKNDEEFAQSFFTMYQMDQRFDYNEHHKKEAYSYSRDSHTWLSVCHYVKANVLGLIPADAVYQAAFETVGLNASLEELSRLVADTQTPYDKNRLKPFLSEENLAKEYLDPEDPFVKKGRELYDQITGVILDVELKRGEMATMFTGSIYSMKRIFGMERLIEILKALGNDKLDRTTYYYWSGGRSGKKESLSYLLQICHPLPGEDAKKLKRLLSGSKIKEQKIIETAMYAPQWLPIIEDYLGWQGLKSGCYYFMAHMNERFDHKKKAMIARYTPLTPEELNDGAFDVSWFEEAYGMLGKERFDRLYDAAKYISDGSKHARARKYADAALGIVDTSQLEPVIKDKRNKDLLMSYGLVPVQGKEDLLHRYEFLQEFLKESRQFGAQRRASEGTAVSIALKNMATAAGYTDVTRLTLAMESELIKTYRSYFEPHTVEEVSLKLLTDENGRTEICCEKAGKRLKSVPSRLKKNEYYKELKEIHKKLKEQYARTVKMMEQSMEEREIYRYGELWQLLENPVIAPILRSLVFWKEGKTQAHGFLDDKGLHDCYGKSHRLSETAQIRVAHPFDLYHNGCWHEYQKQLFESAADGTLKKQSFKQIFRELYVKLPEEAEKERSTMFAGNQIQPSKTAACLKQRRWVADYEEGLQKIYYKENLIAHIYALADWFSPSEIEAPTLEWVEFTDRRTFQSVKIKDIPDIVYSEVMRDVDLAVSVAHAGGVDPETSHSTIKMRSAILEFCLPLFQISNVRLKDSHALIKGSRGSYSIHLGSGIIHQTGGHQLHVLPVHSQGRGKLFLPFLDEDPKTAEIISKIVLFAEDQKIKDPYILDQITSADEI